MRVLRVEKEQSDFGTIITGLFIITHHFHAKLTLREMCVCVYTDFYLNESEAQGQGKRCTSYPQATLIIPG